MVAEFPKAQTLGEVREYLARPFATFRFESETIWKIPAGIFVQGKFFAQLFHVAVPKSMWRDIFAYFKRDIFHEAYCLILWDLKEDNYKLLFPSAITTETSVSYKNDYDPTRYRVVYDIHSHGTMPAYFSQTDNHDDKMEIKISMVVGELDTIPSIAVRGCLFGEFFSGKRWLS